MANLYPVAGCRIYIGGVLEPTNVDFTAADFTSQTWVEIDGWSQMGTFGDTAALITTSLINRGRDIKQKGTANGGSMQNVFAIINEDPGQIAALAAAAGGNRQNYAVKVELNDAPTGGTPSERLFCGLFMNTAEAGGEANTIRNMNLNVEINSNIVAVAAAGP